MKTTTKQPNKIRRFQRGIYKAAKNSPNRRFAVLYDKDILQTAWQKMRVGGKAAGVDKMTVKHIEYEIGVQNFLEDIENELKSQAYKPQLVRRVNISKSNGKTRPLGIPTVKDKVSLDMYVCSCDFTGGGVNTVRISGVRESGETVSFTNTICYIYQH